MTNLRRYDLGGRPIFTTHVTYRRRAILVENHDLLLESLEQTRQRVPFDLLAWVVLPDHMHLLVDARGSDVSGIMRRIKLSFSTSLRGRNTMRRGRIWQYRFWDHIIRDQADLNRHLDYIHHNPVKHGFVRRPSEWRLSSFREFVAKDEDVETAGVSTYRNWRTRTYASHFRHRPFLTADEAKMAVVEQLRQLRERDSVTILAFVIMPDHVHLVLHPPDGFKLGEAIGRLKALSARDIIRVVRDEGDEGIIERRSSGHAAVWQRRCYDHNCRTPETVLEKISYCHENPVKRGIVQAPIE